MKVKVADDGSLLHFELVAENNIDRMHIDIVQTAQTAAVKRNGTLTFSVEVPRTELGKYVGKGGE